MKIVADPNIPFVREAFGPLGDVQLVVGRQMTAANVHEADVLLVRSVTTVNATLLDNSRVQFVATATIGTDHVDIGYLNRQGIGFASAAGSNANSVAEYVVAALLELAYRQKFRLRDQTIGVIGVGNVGSRVVRYAQALGMRVLQNDPPRQQAEGRSEFVSLDQVLAEADIVTAHVPLLETTRHLFHWDNLNGFWFLNTARGAVAENRALLNALKGNRLSGCVLDVWEHEPHISPELLDAVEIGTPHIAGYSFDGKVAGTRMIYEAVCRHFGVAATWCPQLPPVASLEITVSPEEDEEDTLRRIVHRAYDIDADDAALRADTRLFDRLRAEYPVRREFFNAPLALRGGNVSLREKCLALGFRFSVSCCDQQSSAT